MKVGDPVRVVREPDHDSNTPENVKDVFRLCMGKVFPIIDITADGLVELEVGTVAGEASYMHSIWLYMDEVEPEKKPAKGRNMLRLLYVMTWVVGIGTAAYGVYFQFSNPELTNTQQWLATWYCWPILVAAMVAEEVTRHAMNKEKENE